MNAKPALIRPPAGTKIVVTGSTGYAYSGPRLFTGYAYSGPRLFTVHEHRGSTLVVLVDSKGRQSDWKAAPAWTGSDTVLRPYPRGLNDYRQGVAASPEMIASAEASERLAEACSEVSLAYGPDLIKVERIGRELTQLAIAAAVGRTSKTAPERHAALREAVHKLLPRITAIASGEDQ